MSGKWFGRRLSAYVVVSGFLVFLLAGVAIPAMADDRHAGYYYPPVTSNEVYEARAATLIDATRELRVQFIVNLTQQMLSKPYAPEYVIFAKGERAEKLIIVGLGEGGDLSTIYRARATLAMLTAIARGSRLFIEFKVDDFFTFFDLAKLFGFELITVSDGRSYAHQIEIK